ncbi:MAG: hypothetical protein V1912_11745 [bacterium]
MFYPVELDLSDKSRVQQATVVLNPAESKRLLARTVAGLPEIQNAFANGRLSVSTCSTSAFVLEELTGEKMAPYCYCIGMIADGMLTTSAKDDREAARFFVKGERVEQDAWSFLDTFEKGDAVVKGANAVDPQGNAGVLSSNNQSGTVGALISLLAVRGLPIIMPVGLEKLVASVTDAAAGWGQLTLSRSMGVPVWLYPVTCGLVVTEVQALGVLAGVRARHVSSGGIGGSEGAVVLLLEGYEENITKAWDIVADVKGEPAIAVPRHQFSC